MGAMTEIVGLDGVGEFFAPASADMVDGLIGQYRSMRARIEQIADMVTGETAGAVSYFLDGNGRDSRYGTPSVERLFELDGAIAALNAAYWSKTLALTDVIDCMPQARRDEWNKFITERTCPDYEEGTVRATLQDLLASRQQFFAERVDGIFRNLSGEHVTNSPMGFGKRMIIANVHNLYYSSERCGYINDLRAVIAKFMGRDEPRWNSSQSVVNAAMRHHGEWMPLDGGALRIRVYLKGTAHLEVHPDMAWRLNCVLAQLYPRAIPSEFRQKPKRKPKDFVMMGRPLPFAVLELLGSLRRDRNSNRFDLGYSYSNADKPLRAEAVRVLESIGGVVDTKRAEVEFDYDPRDVLDEIVTSGCIPDQKSHQFYPTLATVADAAIKEADIGSSDKCLEPEAGQGGLADRMPKDRTTCVEISKLHCDILAAKGHNVVNADFLEWSEQAWRAGQRFDRVVMNPPFSEGRAEAHLKAAARLVSAGGRLVAVLPASMRGKDPDLLGAWSCGWSPVFENEFDGTGVSVVILTAAAQA